MPFFFLKKVKNDLIAASLSLNVFSALNVGGKLCVRL